MRGNSIVTWSAAIASLARDPDRLSTAIALHAKMPEWDAVAPTVLIAALGQNGRPDEAASIFHQAPARDIRTWNTFLQAVARNGHVDDAEIVVEKMPERDDVTWTTLSTAYAHAGCVQQAKRVFNGMPTRDLVCWNALSAAFAQTGHFDQCKDLFERMPHHTTLSWNSMISASIRDDRLQDARLLFDYCLDRNIASWSQMIHAAEGLSAAKLVFDSMPAWDTISSSAIVCALARGDHAQCDLVRAFDTFVLNRSAQSWTSLLDAIAQGGHFHLAVQCYQRLPCWDAISSNILVTVHTNLDDLSSAEKTFHSIKHKNIISWTSILSANARLGHLQLTEERFARMPHRNVVAYTVAISTLAQSNRLPEARILFEEMPGRSAICWNAMIAGYAQLGHLLEAELLLLERPVEDSASRNTMIAAYAHHGEIGKAVALFQCMDQRDAISWNAIISALSAAGYPAQALHLFQSMDIEGMPQQEPALLAALDAASQLPSLSAARAIHSSIHGTRLESQPAVLASLITAYGRCGGTAEARELSDRVTDPVAWSCAMDAASRGGAAMDPAAVRAMAVEGLSPDPVVLSLVLLWCSHRGDVHLGLELWGVMSSDFGVVAKEDQWTCAVDLLARSGCLDEAEEVLRAMPFVPGDAAITTLFGAWARI